MTLSSLVQDATVLAKLPELLELSFVLTEFDTPPIAFPELSVTLPVDDDDEDDELELPPPPPLLPPESPPQYKPFSDCRRDSQRLNIIILLQ
jgi:hypothetical protein